MIQMSSSPCVVHRDALKSITLSSLFFFLPYYFLPFLNFNEFKNHKKRLDFPFVCTRLQKRRARQANAPERLHHHHQQHHQQQQRFASFSRRARKSARFFSAVARVFSSSSSSSRGCFCVLFVQTFARKGTRLLSCAVPEGPAFGSEKNQIEVPRSLRFPSLTISERAEAGTCAPFRERPSLRKREREGLVAYFFLFFLGICSSSSLFFCLWSKRDDDVEEKKLRRERGNTNNSQTGKHRTRCQIMETRDGSSECI